MRIIWDEQNNRFQAELTFGDKWQEDMNAAKLVGFKTTGPPSWVWYTTKVSILNKLKTNKPSSGLFLSELAFKKYEILNKKEEEKQNLRKQFKKAQTKAQLESKVSDMYFDEDLKIYCVVVSPTKTKYVSTFVKPKPPEQLCEICDSPLYSYDYPTICLFCKKELDTEQKL